MSQRGRRRRAHRWRFHTKRDRIDSDSFIPPFFLSSLFPLSESSKTKNLLPTSIFFSSSFPNTEAKSVPKSATIQTDANFFWFDQVLKKPFIPLAPSPSSIPLPSFLSSIQSLLQSYPSQKLKLCLPSFHLYLTCLSSSRRRREDSCWRKSSMLYNYEIWKMMMRRRKEILEE